MFVTHTLPPQILHLHFLVKPRHLMFCFNVRGGLSGTCSIQSCILSMNPLQSPEMPHASMNIRICLYAIPLLHLTVRNIIPHLLSFTHVHSRGLMAHRSSWASNFLFHTYKARLLIPKKLAGDTKALTYTFTAYSSHSYLPALAILWHNSFTAFSPPAPVCGMLPL